MGKDFSSKTPIYLQIIQHICSQIIRGDLQPGEKLPSVREMALKMGVNPNTIQRVYMELERESLAEARRGQGTFVTENRDRLQQLRLDLKHDRIKTFIADMTEMGFTTEEISLGLVEYFAKSLNEGDK
ncbi:GntR family transcriptional regulator [Shimazuella kribbensis]|uniref:GntR family transcriptional regulator n=1 Tax=Shimazuella kribbensis TaxID=139808 RepID=UPI0004230B54|nr:GntR family transcriptional regulator [Shimazuella kribbensis]